MLLHTSSDPIMLEKITKSLSITLPPHLLRSKDPRALLVAVFAAWLPLSTAVLVSIIEHLPSPPAAQASRLPAIIDASPGGDQVDQKIREAMVEFYAAKDEPVVAYVSKIIAVPESELPENKRRGGALTAEEAREMGRRKRAEIAKAQALANGETEPDPPGGIARALGSSSINDDQTNGNADSSEVQAHDPEHLIGFARLYSGTISVGDEVYVLPPKFSPANPHATPAPQKATITALYLLMGRGLEPLTSVPAGVVFGVAGLEGHILKSGTLCSQLEGGVNLAGINMGSQPIVRVALEPVNPSDLDKMITGLHLLEQSDPCAEYEVLESGEHVILTAGELHLERCLKDLRERFAHCEIQAGEPIVPYRETIVNAADMVALKNKDIPRGTILATTTSKQVTVRLRVRPLPRAVIEFLVKHADGIRRLYSERHAEDNQVKMDQDQQIGDTEHEQVISGQLTTSNKPSMADFKNGLTEAFAESKDDRNAWPEVVEKITAFGPRRVGPNLLIDATAFGCCRKL